MALLFLYGGLETCLSGWLTTYALRYGEKTLAISEYTTLLLWMSLTVGRAGSSLVMLKVGEKTAQRWGLVLTVAFTVGLATAHSAAGIAAFAVLLGLSLAPFFPATFALLMAEKPAARQAGIVLAVSGLGAAALALADGRSFDADRIAASGAEPAAGGSSGVAGNEFVEQQQSRFGKLIFPAAASV